MRSALAFILLAATAAAQQHPRDHQISDPDTRAWWHTTESLAGDGMEGRDTGSPAYQRAADLVAARFRAAGLHPAGDGHTFFQSVPLHELSLDPAATTITLQHPNAADTTIPFLEHITLAPAANLPEDTTAPLTFRGYCGKEATQEIAGKIVVCFGTQRQGLPSAAERVANVRAGRALGILTLDDPAFTIEPPRWPAAYARTVAIGPEPPTPGTPAILSLRLDAAFLPQLLAGTTQSPNSILEAGGAKQPLPSFDLPSTLHVHTKLTHRSYASPNILALLPGTDPALKQQTLVISAHLDGYGYGTPVAGDRLYNGALDDAAYVALLIRFAENLHRDHRAFKRSILFAVFTGEEKGLLGANYFVDHPTVPKADLAADINLDQLRPLFPLHLLTALAIDDTTLGQTARDVGAQLHIALRPDPEPERNLLRRADHYPFLRIGVPAIGFIFGYEPGTDAERRYREWYQVRYHRPQDDLTQPIDFQAAQDFNRFFYTLAETVVNAPERPTFKPGSTLANHPRP